MASKQAIDSSLSCRRIAVVGVSRDPKEGKGAVSPEALPFCRGVHRFLRRLDGRFPS